MEGSPSRQRLYTPGSRRLDQIYNDPGDDSETIDDEEEIYDPDQELEQKRARLDFKLKNTFEAIFDKYGRDFEGVGDEIDLRTGEVIVDNGHLLEMLDERDAGDARPGSGIRRAQTLDSEEGEIPASVDGQDSQNEEDVLGALSDDDMMEDDMILRGFDHPSLEDFIFDQDSSEIAFSTDDLADDKERPQSMQIAPIKIQSTALPSRPEILAQFGPQLGPQIIKYVSQQRVRDDNGIEPAWRVPDLPSAAPARRPILKSVILQPALDRSPSPEDAPSIWAPILPRRRRLRAESHNRSTNPNSESMVRMSFSPTYPASSEKGDRTLEIDRSRVRNRYTPEDDALLIDWVAKACKQGVSMYGDTMWKQLEAKYPRHTWQSWQTRYYRRHYRRRFGDLELSNPEVGLETPALLRALTPAHVERLDTSRSLRRSNPQRPTRLRRPVQRDPTLITWSQAVVTLESLDPELHDKLLEDARRSNTYDLSLKPPNSSRGILDGPRRNGPTAPVRTEKRRRLDYESSSRYHESQRLSESPVSDNDESNPRAFKDRTIFDSEEESLAESAPCPHADCRHRPSKLYRLDRHAEEELSPLSLHLLHVHHTTPFPCGEVSCNFQGERGFFRQTDLVKHVKNAHPNMSALHRLRGRVDPEVLGIDRDRTNGPGSTSTNRYRTTSGMTNPDRDLLLPQSSRKSYLSSGRRRLLSPSRPGMSTMITKEEPFSVNTDISGPDPGPERRKVSSRAKYNRTVGGFIPNSQSSANVLSSPNPPTSRSGYSSKRPRASERQDHNMFDLTYEFSDEETAPGNLSSPLPTTAPSISGNATAPTMQASSSSNRNAESSKSRLALASGRGPAVKSSPRFSITPSNRCRPISTSIKRSTLVTPATKARETDIVPFVNLDPEDTDELSLGANVFTIISSRPEPSHTLLRNPESEIKCEQSAATNAPNMAPRLSLNKKRGMINLIDDDELDPANSDLPSSAARGSPPRKIVRTVERPSANRSSRFASAFDAMCNSPNKRVPGNINSLPQSIAISSSPPIDAVSNSCQGSQSPNNKGSFVSAPSVEVSSLHRASERKTNMIPVAAPSPQSQQDKAVSHESTKGSLRQVSRGQVSSKGQPINEVLGADGDEALMIKTPGGTWRKCGEAGYTCGRALCFSCNPVSHHPTPQSQSCQAQSEVKPAAVAPAAPEVMSTPEQVTGKTCQAWTVAEEQKLITLRQSGLSWSEVFKAFPYRSGSSVKVHYNRGLRLRHFQTTPKAPTLNGYGLTFHGNGKGFMWTTPEKQTLKTMKEAGSSWPEIFRAFPARSGTSIKKHWYADMHRAGFHVGGA